VQEFGIGAVFYGYGIFAIWIKECIFIFSAIPCRQTHLVVTPPTNTTHPKNVIKAKIIYFQNWSCFNWPDILTSKKIDISGQW